MVVDENSRQQVGPTVSRAGKRRWVIGGIIAAVIVLVGLVAWWMLIYKPGGIGKNNGSEGDVTASHVCGAGLIKEANMPLANSDQVALAPVADKIKKLKGFDSDPNCLYVVLQYDLATGDAAASRNDLSKYEKVYDPAIGLSDALTVSIIPIKELRNNVAFLEQNNKDNEADAKKDADNLSSGSDAADKFQQEHK